VIKNRLRKLNFKTNRDTVSTTSLNMLNLNEVRYTSSELNEFGSILNSKVSIGCP
jgi:hypothetical protein